MAKQHMARVTNGHSSHADFVVLDLLLVRISPELNTQWNQMVSKLNCKKVKHEKDLGVIIDQNLTFRDHITF